MKRLIAAALLVLAAAGFAYAEPAVTVRAIDVKLSPVADARSAGTVPAGTTVDILTREGAWVMIRAGTISGWAKLFDVKAPPVASKGGGSSIAQTLGLAAGTRSASVTTGVRGLDADMLKTAVPNAAELAVFEKGAVSKADAQAFARAGKLQVRDVAPIGSGQ